MEKTILNDGLDDESLINNQGYPIEMVPEEQASIEEGEYEEKLKHTIAENLAFLALGGSI